MRDAPAQAAAAGRMPAGLIAATCAWMAGPGNAALWLQLHGLGALSGAGGAAFGAGLALLLAAAPAALLSLLCWRLTLKPALTLMLLACAVATHFMLAYGVIIDPAMMNNVFQTDGHEVRDLVTARLALVVLLLGMLPAAWVCRTPLRFASLQPQLVRNLLGMLGSLAVVIAVLLAVFPALSATVRNHHEMRYRANPLNTLYALVRAGRPALERSLPPQPTGTDARLAPRTGLQHAPLLVLVLGETARSGNFALNGYDRETTPELATQGVLSFRNAWSCGTSTAASVPCMFSPLGRRRFESRAGEVENLLDVLQHAGLAVLWLDNQAGCKGVCARVPAARAATDDAALCHGGECLDEVMLRGLDDRIAALPAPRRERGVVVVLHAMGSHGPAYHRRSPGTAKPFQPECRTASLQDCTRDEVVNAYDNSIAYTDHFLALAIRWLETQPGMDTALLYVSDHGESLGEGNLYLHGLPYALAPDVQKRVPWITWMSSAFAHGRGLDTACLAAQRDRPVSHDDYFHSVLGLLGVRTRAYRAGNDVYAACRDRRPDPAEGSASPGF